MGGGRGSGIGTVNCFELIWRLFLRALCIEKGCRLSKGCRDPGGICRRLGLCGTAAVVRKPEVRTLCDVIRNVYNQALH